MGETIAYIIGFILMFGIPHLIDKGKEQRGYTNHRGRL